MVLEAIGAGVGRTGTLSLKQALETLLEAPCYHMVEVARHPHHPAQWLELVNGAVPDWTRLFEGYRATVDWPAAAFWPELTQAFPQALVVLSERDPESWYESARTTVFDPDRPSPGAIKRLMRSLRKRRFTADVLDRDAALRAYCAHNEAVRRQVPADRLVVWNPGDGWEPLCRALDKPVPDVPFPWLNRRSQFRGMFGSPSASD